MESAGSSGSPVEPPVRTVQLRFDLNPVQMTGSDRNGDRSTVGPVRPAGPVRFLKHCKIVIHLDKNSKFTKIIPTTQNRVSKNNYKKPYFIIEIPIYHFFFMFFPFLIASLPSPPLKPKIFLQLLVANHC